MRALPLIMRATLFTLACVFSVTAYADFELLKNIHTKWRSEYPNVTKGQKSAQKNWANTSERAYALTSLQNATLKLNKSFNSFEKKQSTENARLVVEGIVVYCQAIKQVSQLQGAFASVSFIMDLSDSEIMGKIFHSLSSDQQVKNACSN